MADPVRVQREESFQTSGPPTVLTVGYVNPDDLARAIREGVDARLRKVADVLGYYVGVAQHNDDTQAMKALDHTMHAVLDTLDTPREPAQERQEAPEPPQHAEAMADLLRELEGWKDGPNSSDDTRRKHWLMRRAAATIRALTPPTPTPDPLLPGLRAADAEYERLCADPHLSQRDVDARFAEWTKAEIARREGGQR